MRQVVSVPVRFWVESDFEIDEKAAEKAAEEALIQHLSFTEDGAEIPFCQLYAIGGGRYTVHINADDIEHALNEAEYLKEHNDSYEE